MSKYLLHWLIVYVMILRGLSKEYRSKDPSVGIQVTYGILLVGATAVFYFINF